MLTLTAAKRRSANPDRNHFCSAMKTLGHFRFRKRVTGEGRIAREITRHGSKSRGFLSEAQATAVPQHLPVVTIFDQRGIPYVHIFHPLRHRRVLAISTHKNLALARVWVDSVASVCQSKLLHYSSMKL